MRLEITGNVDPFNLEDTVTEAVGMWIDKIEQDNPAVGELLLADETEINISAITVDFKFKLAGSEEWQVITTDNHEGIDELLIVKAETDDDGKLLFDSVKDNDGDSEFTEIEALIAQGLPKSKKPIESIYHPSDLTEIDCFYFEDEDVLISKTIEGNAVVQVFADTEGNEGLHVDLIAEVEYEAENLQKLLEHYGELEKLAE